MLKYSWLCLFALVGCSSSAPKNQRADLPEIVAEEPDLNYESTLALFSDGKELHVGYGLDQALSFMPRPPKAHEFSDLPYTLPKEYKVRGWETQNEGFGVIGYKDRGVVAAVYQLKTDRDRRNEILQTYQKRLKHLPETSMIGTYVSYRFWEDGPYRLMINVVEPPRDGSSVTIAVGDKKVMDDLGMSVASAKRDKEAAEAQFRQTDR